MSPIEVALAYIRSFESGSPDSIADWVTDDFTNNQMGVLGSRFQGGALYRQRLSSFLGRFQGLVYTPDIPIAQGNRVTIPYVMHAQDDGRPLTIEGVMIITVDGERVSRRDDYWDGLTYFQQIGVALPSAD